MAKRYYYAVSHADYGSREVVAASEVEAIQKAAAAWADTWQRIAGWCDVRRLQEAKEIRCAACGGEYFGMPGGICVRCARQKANSRAAAPRIKRADRRAEG